MILWFGLSRFTIKMILSYGILMEKVNYTYKCILMKTLGNKSILGKNCLLYGGIDLKSGPVYYH